MMVQSVCMGCDTWECLSMYVWALIFGSVCLCMYGPCYLGVCVCVCVCMGLAIWEYMNGPCYVGVYEWALLSGSVCLCFVCVDNVIIMQT